jgi:hypothetical protein
VQTSLFKIKTYEAAIKMLTLIMQNDELTGDNAIPDNQLQVFGKFVAYINATEKLNNEQISPDVIKDFNKLKLCILKD